MAKRAGHRHCTLILRVQSTNWMVAILNHPGNYGCSLKETELRIYRGTVKYRFSGLPLNLHLILPRFRVQVPKNHIIQAGAT